MENKTNGKLFGCAALLGVLVLATLIFGSFWWGLRNREISLRNEIKTHQDTMSFSLDKVLKVINQKGQVTDKYAGDVKEVVIKAMEARYRTGGEMFKAVQEASGQPLDSSLYKDLSQTIEAQREGFYQAQVAARERKREHDTLLDTYGFFLPSAKKIDLVFVTSAATKESFKTGEENDISVFDKK